MIMAVAELVGFHLAASCGSNFYHSASCFDYEQNLCKNNTLVHKTGHYLDILEVVCKLKYWPWIYKFDCD